MGNLKDIVRTLDEELNISEIKDYPGAVNGLQLENDGEVSRIFAAVDASVGVIEQAAAEGGGLLIVHHGLFWQGVQTLTGARYRKICAAVKGNLAIYSAHLPLDWHPTHGNNVLLAGAIGLQGIRPILIKDGWPMGVAGIWQGSRTELVEKTSRITRRAVTLCPGAGETIGQVAVITGGAGSEVAKIAACGIDTFITGEGPHWSFIESEELGINTLYAGHYATETFGVKSIAAWIARTHDLPLHFVDRVGGL